MAENASLNHEIRKTFTFEAAHRLPNLRPDHKCFRLHGHSFRATLIVRGALVKDYDWVIDFAEMKSLFSPILDQLDHHYLNEISGLENPTSEVLAKWIYNRLLPTLPGLHQVVLSETCTSEAAYPARD